LSFSSWKDSSASTSSFALDSSQGLASPRHQNQIGGTVEDWGIAFEGLPIDSRLYPAVGLYQRDDRVTLLTVESGSSVSSGHVSGDFYFPKLNADDDPICLREKSRVREFNDALACEAIQYVTETLTKTPQVFDEGRSDSVIHLILPSLASALCLVPRSVPVLSSRYALTLMPHLSRCILELERIRTDREDIDDIFQGGPNEGKWAIRATGASGTTKDYEEYVVDFAPITDEAGVIVGFEGSGVGTTGKSKNGLVRICGTTKGSSLSFVEEWSEGNERGHSSSSSDDASSCVVWARLSLDGNSFEGTYRNVQYGSIGRIAGVRRIRSRCGSLSQSKSISGSQNVNLDASLRVCAATLCLAYSHFSTILSEDSSRDLEENGPFEVAPQKRQTLKRALCGSFLASASLKTSETMLRNEMGILRKLYAVPEPIQSTQGKIFDDLLALSSIGDCLGHIRSFAVDSGRVKDLDEQVSSAIGGVGSFRSLCPNEYDAARISVIAVLLHVCGMEEILSDIGGAEKSGGVDDVLESVWRGALKVLEDGTRKALSNVSVKTKRELCAETCRIFSRASTFLLSLEWLNERKRTLTVHAAVEQTRQFYNLLESESDIEYLRAEMNVATRRGVVRLASIDGMAALLSSDRIKSPVWIECLCVGLPRLLGPSQDDSREDAPTAPAARGEYPNHRFPDLAGSSCRLRVALQQEIRKLNQSLGLILDRETAKRSKSSSSGHMTAIDSLVLSLLAVFAGQATRDDVVQESKVLDCIPQILAIHRPSILESSNCAENDDEKMRAATAIQAIFQRDVSRAVLRCSVAVAHAVSYQTICFESDSQMLSHCLIVLMGELAATLPLVLADTYAKLPESVSRRFDNEVCLWAGSCSQKHKDRLLQNESNTPYHGLRFLLEHGTLQISVAQAPVQAQKPSRQKSSSSSVRSYAPGLTKASFSDDYVSQWLHILATALRFPKTSSAIAGNADWFRFLLDAVGLTLEESSEHGPRCVSVKAPEKGSLPAHFRSRTLRLMTPLLISMEPSQELVEGLFALAGSASNVATWSLDEDEWLVSREAISLTRQLHSPSTKAWRGCINRAIQSCASDDNSGTDSLSKKVGVLSFLSGDLVSIGRGSYVLLKPSAAVSISQEHQQAPSGKGHSSGVGGGPPTSGTIPHHIVGNGTESVVAGLCRFQASAGIVSNIDTKNGVCEVILLSRDEEPLNGQDNGRHALTVRALRAPLSDVVLAQEVPLLLDDSISWDSLVGSMLLSSLYSLSAAPGAVADDASHSSEKDATSRTNVDLCLEAEQKRTNLCLDLMVLRGSIVLLSDQRLLSRFLSQDIRTSVLPKLLDAASPTCDGSGTPELAKSSRHLSLSSLPVHEARYCHLQSMLRDVSFRMELTEQIRAPEWDASLRKYRSLAKEAAVTAEPTGNTAIGSPPPARDTLDAAGSSFVGTSRTEMAGTRDADSHSNRSISQSTGGSNSDEDEDESEAAAATAAAHLREAAIAQMAELGLPRSWSELALRRTGGTNIEAAVTFCLERGAEMERLLSEERERDRLAQRGAGSSGRRRGNRDSTTNHLLRQLQDMGFPPRWCAEALAVTGNNVDEALTWILTNGERLSEEDEAAEAEGEADDVDEEEEDSGDDDEEEEEDEETDAGDAASEQKPNTDADSPKISSEKDSAAIVPESTSTSVSGAGSPIRRPCWSGSIVPLRFISGRASINSQTLEVSGLPSGGFSSVGTKGILLTSGKWYYEAVLGTAGCLQIGWADGSFAGHCNSDRGDGCGDGPSSWAYDGWRRYRWHSTATEWGCRWKEGDIVGCLVDLDEKVVSFTLNGKGESIGMGVAFSGEGFRPCGGVYACVSFNRREKLRLILGGEGCEPFNFQPPPGYRGVGDAVLDATAEMDLILEKEAILGPPASPTPEDSEKRFLCDFSDGDHGHELMAWAHRYYGSDASVHLGSGRLKIPQGSSKSSPQSSSYASSPGSCLSRRLELEWSKKAVDGPDQRLELSQREILEDILAGYKNVHQAIQSEIVNESITMAKLLARKLILHMMITMGSDFDLRVFGSGDDDMDVSSTLSFWHVIESSASLRGWVGEAGAMALAAEALGLGISSNEQITSRGSSDRVGIASAFDLDDGLYLPTAGITQLLSSILVRDSCDGAVATANFLVAGAEAAIGSDSGGGLQTFLRESLMGAVRQSGVFQKVLLAVVRRALRLLSVVEYDGESELDVSEVRSTLSFCLHLRFSFSFSSCLVYFFQDEDDSDRNGPFGRLIPRKSAPDDSSDPAHNPDARLIAFLSGLLLTSNANAVSSDLAEAWSVGLLSASLPWRMLSAFTVAGILNQEPRHLSNVLASPTLARYFGRLPSTVSRRIWAERAASPVCSRYSQAMVELVASVNRAVPYASDLAREFSQFWSQALVDAAMPVPLEPIIQNSRKDVTNWEADDGWVSSDRGWEIWSGTVEYVAVDWKAPSRSGVRNLMDTGQGPPMLDEGCFVMRGVDWNSGDVDGNSLYEGEKEKRDKEKRLHDEQEKKDTDGDGEQPPPDNAQPPAEEKTAPSAEDADDRNVDPADPEPEPSAAAPNVETPETPKKKKKKKKIPSPKLPLGIVLSVEPWNGVPAMARRVKWLLTGEEGIYRYGGDGGQFDLCHVETNEKQKRVRKKHPLAESAEQCAARHGFGLRKVFSVILRIRKDGSERNLDDQFEYHHEGILELPDFGAGIRISCVMYGSGSVSIEEKDLLYGSKDSGWEARFGQPSYCPGTNVTLIPAGDSSRSQAELDAESSVSSMYEELHGSTSFSVKNLKNRADGSAVKVTSEMRLFRPRRRVDVPSPITKSPCPPPPLSFDNDHRASSISISRDGRTASCIASDGRGTAFASVGFSKGRHYWEIKLEQADIGSVFIGVAEKPSSSGSGSSYGYDPPPRLNRWHGWGFVNFRATYTSGAERVYGAHCHAGDTVGVLLDCDAGRLSFFFDGLKYGEHILNDLGCAFENLSPFGFNVDGCGSGGAGQGAPSGFESGRGGRYPTQGAVRPRTLWPVIGLRNQGDRVTISSKWNTGFGVDGATSLRNILAVDELLHRFSESSTVNGPKSLPSWFIREAYYEYKRWYDVDLFRTETRGSGPYKLSSFGLELDLDCSAKACAAGSAGLGLPYALLAGDRVRLTRSAGRILELAEEAVVLGAYQGRLYYRIVSQKSEGGSLTEGGGRAWCWDESEVVDGLPFVSPGKGLNVELPKLNRFKCLSSGGLRVVYESGAVLRSDLEIFDGSSNLGTIPVDTVIPKCDVFERRVNSCGVVRYRVKYGDIGEGWISARIRGGKEEMIVKPVEELDSSTDDSAKLEASFATANECADAWYPEWRKAADASEAEDDRVKGLNIQDLETFEKLVGEAIIPSLSQMESDAILSASVSVATNFSEVGDAVECSFREVAAALSFVSASSSKEKSVIMPGSSPAANQAVAAVFSRISSPLPSLRAMLARISLLRAFNRRARLALPWLSLRPCQEGSSILGGTAGHGTSTERAGRARLVNTPNCDDWVRLPSIASRIRELRGLFFSSVKRGLLCSITDTTTTPTPLSHDEYELPREIRTVRINRLKAARAMASDDIGAKRKYSVFSQLQSETRSWGGAALRRGHVAKGHGGQKRAFKVKLIGEGVNDYSGPYREAFTDAISELMETDGDGHGALGVIDPTPNNASAIGDDRDLFMFSLNGRDVNSVRSEDARKAPTSAAETAIRRSFASLLAARDEPSREVEEALVFLGRLVGTAYRHGISVDLPLALNSIWKALVEDPAGLPEQLKELDYLAYRQLAEDSKSGDFEASPLLGYQKRMLNAFAEGLGNVIPVELFPLLSGEELRDTLCGNPDVDVDLLKLVVEYEGYEPDQDKVIGYFWETLREFSNDERKKFLQFVWARNRLPMRESDFEAPFKIQKDAINAGSDRVDLALPSASTCFFSLTLPEYSTKEILKSKLLFAINNVTTMETDFQTNSAEISEGYRTF